MSESQAITVTALDLRERLGLSAGHASDLANKRCPPSLKMALRIERELGVPVEYWEDVESRSRKARHG